MSAILDGAAVDFLVRLHRQFEPARQELLGARRERAARLASGEGLDFRADSLDIRRADWSVAPAPTDLDDRRVEITGPAEAKMTINALNSGARVFMADFEDSLSPTWSNVVEGQAALRSAVRRELTFRSPEGKAYTLGQELATLVVRPRGWHLLERHHLVDGEPMSGALFDFGLYLLHNGRELLERGSGPYFYLAKLQGAAEAKLWNDVFEWSQDALGLPRGSIRATVLIETIWAAFEMDEILYALRDHAAGLNAGRWDYIFSLIKTFADRPDMVLPDRAQVTMAVPFMRAYTQLLVRTCHRRGAHAIGGMSAFIPNRREPDVTARALEKVREDKVREAGDGFDGTWVAHPDLVALAGEIFDGVLAERPHQKDRLREDVSVGAAELLDVASAGGSVTEDGLRNNVSVALQYLDAWLRGTGAAAINNLMEDLATAEISRSQLWQWRRHGAQLEDGRVVDEELYRRIAADELAKLGGRGVGRLDEAAGLLGDLVLAEQMPEFASLLAYPLLD